MVKRFFSYDPAGDGMVFHETAEAAEKTAVSALEAERDSAFRDGWSDDVTDICWGEIRERVVETERRASEEGERFDFYLDHGLAPVIETPKVPADGAP